MRGPLNDRVSLFCATIAVAMCFMGAPVEGSLLQEMIPLQGIEKTKVMILGTPHLRVFGDEFDGASLDALLSILEGYAPDLIGIESLSPRAITAMQAREEEYLPALEQFAMSIIERGSLAREALGVTLFEARTSCAEILSSQPSALSQADRVKLVANLLAAYECYSALLQWSYLDEETRAGDELLPAQTRADFDDSLSSPNEIVTIGLALARRLGHQRIYPIDDHADKDDYLQFAEQLGREMQSSPAVAAGDWQTFYADSNERMRAAHTGGNLLPYYLYMNSPEYAAADIGGQWHLFFRMKLESGLDRARIALWEVRNLNIASNIRRLTARKPGSRVLVIIGASHKHFLDEYLGKMMDVEVVDLADLVGE